MLNRRLRVGVPLFGGQPIKNLACAFISYSALRIYKAGHVCNDLGYLPFIGLENRLGEEFGLKLDQKKRLGSCYIFEKRLVDGKFHTLLADFSPSIGSWSSRVFSRK